MSINFSKVFPFVLLILCLLHSCKDKPFKPNFENAGGYVIGKEHCNLDTTLDYWLIDLSIFPLPNNYGDTILFNGVEYRHVVKTLELSQIFKQTGARVDFDFYLSENSKQTIGCSVVNPVTFLLKEMDVLAQGEIR